MAQTRDALEPRLVKFSDLRDKRVFALDDEEIGTVKDLYLDEDEREVRYLEVGAGGFLGIGQRLFLIPIEAVSGMSAERVTLNQSREKVLGSPEFAPGHVLEDHDRRALSRHYGFPR